ncbi:MAG: hypothetical protein IPL95_16690 [Saprospiraceae bacterium]|nr:hypothetical protein [Saprospiraceae bacterium]
MNAKILFSYLALPISSLIKPWQPQINYSINWMHDNSLWLSSPENVYKLIPGNDIGKATVMQYTPKVFGIKPLKGDWVKFFPVRNDKDKSAHNSTI